MPIAKIIARRDFLLSVNELNGTPKDNFLCVEVISLCFAFAWEDTQGKNIYCHKGSFSDRYIKLVRKPINS